MQTFFQARTIGISIFIALAGGVFTPVLSLAFDSRIGIDPERNLPELIRTQQVWVETKRSGGVIHSNASAVLKNVDLSKLVDVTVAFDRHVEYEMPNFIAGAVLDCRPVSSNQDMMLAWIHMTSTGQSSRHYMDVRITKSFPASPPDKRAALVEYQLARPRPLFTRPNNSVYLDDSAFSRLDGSWYFEELPGGYVYVRYFVATIVDPGFPVPAALVTFVVRNEASKGVRQVIQRLARLAAVRH